MTPGLDFGIKYIGRHQRCTGRETVAIRRFFRGLMPYTPLRNSTQSSVVAVSLTRLSEIRLFS